MVQIIEWLRKNRIKLIKILITVIIIFVLFCSLKELLKNLTQSFFQSVIIIYLILLLLCNLLSEFSPYILHNYLLSIFPFLSNYFGRGMVYILIGILYLSPGLSNEINWGGYLLLLLGFICIWINRILSQNIQADYQHFVDMKDNYQDFSNSAKESLKFPENQS